MKKRVGYEREGKKGREGVKEGNKLESERDCEGGRDIQFVTGLPGPKNFKRPNLAISSFKKGQILKDEKGPNKGQIFFEDFFLMARFQV